MMNSTHKPDKPYTSKSGQHKVKEVRQIVVPTNLIEFPKFTNQTDGMYDLMKELSLLFDMCQYNYKEIVSVLKKSIKAEQKFRMKEAQTATQIRAELVAEATAEIDKFVSENLFKGNLGDITSVDVKLEPKPAKRPLSTDIYSERRYPIHDRMMAAEQGEKSAFRNPGKEDVVVEMGPEADLKNDVVKRT